MIVLLEKWLREWRPKQNSRGRGNAWIFMAFARLASAGQNKTPIFSSQIISFHLVLFNPFLNHSLSYVKRELTLLLHFEYLSVSCNERSEDLSIRDICSG